MTEISIAESRAVVVLGMHRSGTSVLTSGLGAVGVYLGDRLMPGKDDNPKGFFEDLDLTAINLDLLAQLGCRWDSLRLADWRDLDTELQQQYLKRAVEVVEHRFAGISLWGFKDPRVTRLMSFWDSVLALRGCRPVFVVANRHPLSVAASLARRDGMALAYALLLWLLHQAEALRIVLDRGGLVVSYDGLMECPREQLLRLARFLGQESVLDMVRLAEFEREFLDETLRHSAFRRDGCDLEFDALGRMCKRLYLHLETWAAVEQPAHILQAEARDMLESLKQWLVDHASMIDVIDCSMRQSIQMRSEQIGLARDSALVLAERDRLKRQSREFEQWCERLWCELREWQNQAEMVVHQSGELRLRVCQAESRALRLALMQR